MILIFYLLIINLVGFLAMLHDKRQARKGGWRIAERTLFLISVIGGSVGILAGQKAIRHKTLKLSFKFGIPLIILIQSSLGIYLLF